ncbi:hypothetical protein FPRO04_12378 [Fusarium proliferatum]|nr:hypothetical protein FPRO03_05608 [Fusarium proliferatum]KAG4268417.1 hypothetical protein FPRO04_12378 [Fusarium proliferatum]
MRTQVIGLLSVATLVPSIVGVAVPRAPSGPNQPNPRRFPLNETAIATAPDGSTTRLLSIASTPITQVEEELSSLPDKASSTEAFFQTAAETSSDDSAERVPITSQLDRVATSSQSTRITLETHIRSFSEPSASHFVQTAPKSAALVNGNPPDYNRDSSSVANQADLQASAQRRPNQGFAHSFTQAVPNNTKLETRTCGPGYKSPCGWIPSVTSKGNGTYTPGPWTSGTLTLIAPTSVLPCTTLQDNEPFTEYSIVYTSTITFFGNRSDYTPPYPTISTPNVCDPEAPSPSFSKIVPSHGSEESGTFPLPGSGLTKEPPQACLPGKSCASEKPPGWSNPTAVPGVPGLTMSSSRMTVTFVTTDKNPAVVFPTEPPPHFDRPTGGGGLPVSNKQQPQPSKAPGSNHPNSSGGHGKSSPQSGPQPDVKPRPSAESGPRPTSGPQPETKPSGGPQPQSRPDTEPEPPRKFFVTARGQEVIVNDKTFSSLRADQTTTVTVDYGTFTIRPTEVVGEGATVRKPQPVGTVISVVSPTSATIGKIPVTVSGTEAIVGGTRLKIPLMGTTTRLMVPVVGSNTIVEERQVSIAPDSYTILHLIEHDVLLCSSIGSSVYQVSRAGSSSAKFKIGNSTRREAKKGNFLLERSSPRPTPHLRDETPKQRTNKLLNCFNTLAPASQTVQISRARSASFSPEFQAFSYMQQEPLENTEHLIHRDNPYKASLSQHGPLHHDPRGLLRVYSGDSSGTEPGSAPALRHASGHDVDTDLLDEELRRLSLGHRSTVRPSAPGQRISEYENAMTPPTPNKALGFKVIKRSDTPSDGVQLEDFPNEILTHILSHLHSDSHAAIALVSKRFYALITSSHAWRMAFLRFFPGHEALEIKKNVDMWAHSSHDLIQSESRYFTRLTPMASWRKEYLLRTRLIRGLARGKPGASFASGGIGASVRTGKKTSAVLTYNSKLPWAVTNIHAVFTNGKKPPKAIHGAADLGVASLSDPTNGRIEKWGFVDPFNSMQLDEVFPNLVPFGLGEGPAAIPNVLDVSQPYGVLAGEGFPGGRPYYRPVNENRGRYLGADSGVVDTYPDIPKIPEMSESMCSVWLAKSSNVPTNTQSMIGMLTGSTLGVVTSYALGTDSGPQRYQPGEVTARWVLSPGVPIISLKVDDNYSQKRKSSARVWIVALNALGEVFYLTETPTAQNATKSEDITKNAWFAGRSVYWHLLDSTRRVARPDDSDKNAIKGAYSPRSPSNSMSLSKSQLAAEAREIEKFLRQKPAHFRRVCEGWDMQRKLEVDFANDDGHGAGENIFVIDCGLAENRPAHIQRYTRSLVPQDAQSSSVVLAPMAPDVAVSVQPSLFGTTAAEISQGPNKKISQSVTSTSVSSLDVMSHLHEWESCSFRLKGQSHAVITSASMDQSSTSVLTLSEDPLRSAEEEIPGRRSRLLAVGTDDGAVLVWNAREDAKATGISPVRQIQTDSPEVSCVALSAMYVVHGGSDGLVQAWDPLASTLDPVRTLNARSNGRVPRHMVTMNPTLDESTYSAVGAIYLDPDPTVLRGVVSFGAFLRYWAYSSASHASGRKRRLRHSDVHGRLASRRQGSAVIDFIAAEEAEIKRENEQKAREQNRLRNRFGVGALGDLTEEEALRYAQMVSEEAFLFEEQRRTSDSAADASLDTASTFSETTTVDTVTPEPSVSDMITPPSASTDKVEIAPVEDDYEQQIQQAIRLSLMEGVNDKPPSPQAASSGDYEFSLTYKSKSGRKNKTSGTASPGLFKAGSSNNLESRDYDLELALKLSMEEQGLSAMGASSDVQRDEFPALETEGVGKGKGVQRW